MAAGCDSKDPTSAKVTKAETQDATPKKPVQRVPELNAKMMLPNKGSAFTYSAPQFAADGDTMEQPNRSTFSLLEDAKPLGPAHAPHQHIREQGKGRWSHWGDTIYFSSSDGTDPRQNNQKYVLVK